MAKQSQSSLLKAEQLLTKRWLPMEHPYTGCYSPNPQEVIEQVSSIFNQEIYYRQPIPDRLYDLFDSYIDRYGDLEEFVVTSTSWPQDPEAKYMIIMFRADGLGTRFGFIPEGATKLP